MHYRFTIHLYLDIHNYYRRTSHYSSLNRKKQYKNWLKKYNRRNVTRTADISISIVSLFACTVVRSLSIVAHSISTAVRFSCGTLADI